MSIYALYARITANVFRISHGIIQIMCERGKNYELSMSDLKDWGKQIGEDWRLHNIDKQ